MSARGGDNPPWPGAEGHQRPAWQAANNAQSGRSASRRGAAQPQRRLPAILWLVCGALIGAILTIGLLFLAGPRPVSVPAPTGVGHVTVTMDDAYLTSAVRQAVGSVPVIGSVTNLTAHAEPGDQMLLSGTSNGAPLSITLQPLLSNGVVSVHVADAHIGGLPLPSFIDGQAESAINSQLATLSQSALSGTHYVVTSVTTTSGHIVLTLGSAS
jgi:hypothetical protein